MSEEMYSSLSANYAEAEKKKKQHSNENKTLLESLNDEMEAKENLQVSHFSTLQSSEIPNSMPKQLYCSD